MNQPSLLVQMLSSFGALCCLVAFVGHQLHWLDARKAFYNALNIVGAGVLFYIALRPFQVGFVVMEGVWCLVSIMALYKSLRVNK